MAPISMAYDKYQPEGKISNLNPIILCHGLLMTKAMFRELCIRLCNETGREVFCFDCRCHGDSPRCDDFSIDLVAEDLKHFFQEHGIKKASIIAFSLANHTCLKVFENDGHFVEKFISVEVTKFSTQSQRFGGWIAKFMGSRLAACANLLDPVYTEEEGKEIFIEVLTKDSMLNISRPVAALHTRDLIKSGNRFQLKSDFERILQCVSEGKMVYRDTVYEGETLCIFGELSTLSRESRHSVKDIFPNCKVVVIAGGTHEVLLEKPKEFVDEVKRFLQVEA